MFVYLFWERESMWGGAEREGDRESQAGLTRDSISWTMRSWPELKSRVGRLTDWATQAPLVFFYFKAQVPYVPCLAPWGAPTGKGQMSRERRICFGSNTAERTIDLVTLLRPHILRGFRASSPLSGLCSHGHMPRVTGTQAHNCLLINEGKSVLSRSGCLQCLYKIAFQYFFH